MFSGFSADEIPFFLQFVLIFLAGLSLGSFATALSYRIPRGIPWALGKGASRSACTTCEHPLSVKDLVPVFSFLWLRGKCRNCKHKITIDYFFTEIAAVFFSFLAWLSLGFSLDLFWAMLAIPFLLALLVIDLKKLILPDQLVFIVLLFGVLRLLQKIYYPGADPEVSQALFISATMGFIFYGGLAALLGFVTGKILRKDALGFGDVKFFAVSGLWLGIGLFPYFLMLSGILGVVFSIFWKMATQNDIFPFGPALIAAFYGLLLFGEFSFG